MDPQLADAPFRNRALPTAERVDDLIGRMTIEEKIAQLGCVWSTQLAADEGFSPEKAARHLAHGTGQVTRIGAATGLRPRESAAFMNEIQRFLVEETRLGIPAIVHEESTGGFTARDADQLPQAIGLASTFDPDGVEQAGRLIREQMRAVGARLTLAPVLDIARDPRWGRVEETYGEDPYLAGRIGVAYVRGVQGASLREGVAATGKHFLGYGLSEGGHNHKPVHLGARALREVYARPFREAIAEAGLASIMNAYNDVDGLPCGGSKEILDDLLRGELGFEGVVVADYFTTRLLVTAHRVAATETDAGQMALEAGLDVELPSIDCYAGLVERVKTGALDESVVDRSLRRALAMKFELGLFEEAYVDAEAADAPYQTPEARALARRLACESIVLLRNEGDLLPLDPATPKIAVLGPCADDVRLLQGDYHYPAHVEIVYQRQPGDAGAILPRPDESSFAAGPFYPPSITPLAGIREAVSGAVAVERGCDVQGDDASGIASAVAAARDADVAIVCVGGKSGLMPDCTSGEFRDASDLSLTGLQQRLVEEVVATGTPTVVVLVNGRVLSIPWIAENVPAVVEAWLPGEEGGGAIADVLFGRVNPAGRLPVSLPRDVGQVPIYYARKWEGGAGPVGSPADYVERPATPLYPFGHGLSYTRFEYGELALGRDEVGGAESLEISFTLTNAGERAGEEVVQLYLQDLVASVTRPIAQLAGFARIALEPGESRRVCFDLDVGQLAFYDRSMRFVVEPGDVAIRVGASSEDIRCEARLRVGGATVERDPNGVRATEVSIT